MNVEIKNIDIPANLDKYLREKESKIPDIIPGAQKRIIWFDSLHKNQTPISIIYLPGFLATAQEVSPLCALIARQIGANIFYSRPTGQGRTSEDAMKEATLDSWLNDAVEAFKIGELIGEKILIIGTSTGCTLATWLASYKDSEKILGLILISPNFAPKEFSATLLSCPGAKYFIPLILGKYRTWKPLNENQAKYWTTRYPTKALFTMMSLVELVNKIDFNQINSPFLIFLSRKDKVVDSRKTEKIFLKLKSPAKKMVFVEDSQDPKNHVIVGDIMSPNTTPKISHEIISFIELILAVNLKGDTPAPTTPNSQLFCP